MSARKRKPERRARAPEATGSGESGGPRALALALVAVFGVVSMLPVLASGDRLGVWDWDHHFASAELERQAVLEHGALPLWNPYLRGGLPVLQHPLGAVLAPDFWIVLLAGVPLGFKLLLAFRFAVGLAGGWLLGRELSLTPPAAGLFAVLATGSGAWTAHVVLGHAEWSLLAYVPWILLALLRALPAAAPEAARAAQGRRPAPWIVAAAAGTALLYLGGNVYLLVALALFAGALVAVLAWRRRRPALLLVGLAPFVLAAGLAGAKLLPTLELFRDHARPGGGFKRLLSHEPASAWAELPRALHFVLLERDVPWPEDPAVLFHRPLGDYTRAHLVARQPLVDFVNFGAYLGVLPLLLLPFAVLSRGPVAGGLAAGSGLLLLLALSDPLARALGPDPWGALQTLPVFGTLRTPGRFLAVAIVGVAALCALGLDAALRRAPLSARARDALALAALAVVVADHGLRNARALAGAFPVAAPETPRAERFVTRLVPFRGSDYLSVVARSGALAAHDNLGLRSGAVPIGAPGYAGEAFLVADADAGTGGAAADGEPGEARLLGVAPNALEVAVRAARPATLVVNQTWLPGWRRVDREAPVFAVARRVATRVGPGEQRVRLVYRPRLLDAGIALSLATLAGCAAWLALPSLRRRFASRP